MEMHDVGYEAGGIALAGCLFIGIGLGILFHQYIAGPIIGLGVGLIVMAFFRGR